MKPLVVVSGAEIADVLPLLSRLFKENGVTPTVGAGACLMYFAASLKGSGHPEQVGHDALDHMLRILGSVGDGGAPLPRAATGEKPS